MSVRDGGVLVTGASGFLGTALLARLGGEVTAVSRSAPRRADVESMLVDLRDPHATRLALARWRWGTVVHLAGPAPKGSQDWADSSETIRAHVQSLLHVIAAIPSSWPGRFILASGAIVYGDPIRERVAEDHPRKPLHAYALAKCLTEDIVLGSTLRDRWVLRMGGLFSEERRSGGLFHFIRAARAGEEIRVSSSTPPVPWELLHVDDAVEAVLRSIRAVGVDPGPLNVGYGERIQSVEIAERIARRSSAAPKVTLAGPAPPAFHADITKARGLIDWPPSTLDERLDRLWTAFAEAAG